MLHVMRSYLVPLLALGSVAWCVAAQEAESDEGSTTLLTQETFASSIKEKPHFVMFFAPWCGHCKKLAPIWQELHDELGGFSSGTEEAEAINVGIARVDCTQQTALCSEHQVTGYPTLKFFKDPQDNNKYKGSRSLSDFITYVKKELGLIKEPEKPVPKDVEQGSSLVIHTADTFEKNIAKGHHFVKFFAPWCGHCQRLAPVWEELAEAFREEPQISIGKLDCTEHKDVCSKHSVRGYPTLLWFTDGEQVGERYAGDRSLEAMRTFALEQAQKPSKPVEAPKSDEAGSDSTPSPPEVVSAVLSLSAETFQSSIEKGVTLVKFFAPWCGHCKKMAGAYEELGRKFTSHEGVTIAEVDCTVPPNKELCSEQNVKGFPTLLLYRDGKLESTYSGSRSTEGMAKFVAETLNHDEL